MWIDLAVGVLEEFVERACGATIGKDEFFALGLGYAGGDMDWIRTDVSAARMRDHYSRNREAKLVKMKEYRQLRKADAAPKVPKPSAVHIGLISCRNASYYEANKERIKAARRTRDAKKKAKAA